jgi:UDP-galactopyranose mutase
MKQFGAGLAKYFMMPYNFKVWAHPPRMMNKEWIGERVALPSLQRVLGNVILDKDDAGWGPNNTFKYPLYGGTGGLFERIVPYIKDHLRLESPTVKVDAREKTITLADGTVERYDVLMNTMPMDKFVRLLGDQAPDVVRDEASRLRHSGSFVVGVGVDRPASTTKCWMYYPEGDCPFYRVTYLSNYSPEVVPDHTRQHSLLAEISHSEFKPEDRNSIIQQTIDGMLNTRLLEESDLDKIVDTHLIERDYTYPTPSLERDAALRTVHPWLHEQDIYSRGRFGAWRYEVGNMDHSVAQGVEWVNRVVQGAVEDELTYQAKRGC